MFHQVCPCRSPLILGIFSEQMMSSICWSDMNLRERGSWIWRDLVACSNTHRSYSRLDVLLCQSGASPSFLINVRRQWHLTRESDGKRRLKQRSCWILCTVCFVKKKEEIICLCQSKEEIFANPDVRTWSHLVGGQMTFLGISVKKKTISIWKWTILNQFNNVK